MNIFGLGFHKTGTTTFETALITLGYEATGKRDHLFDAIDENNWETVDSVVSEYEAFRDMPWPLYYQELDQRYPNSKFILTVRDSIDWLESCKNHYKDKGTLIFERIYGEGNHYPDGNEDIWLERYLRHNREVREYFEGRPNDFLEVNWANGDGWEKLCSFLGHEVPDCNFPHANKGKYTFWGKVKRRIHLLIDREGFKKKNRDL